MGAAIGGALAGAGRDVAWASDGRSEETARRAREAGLRDAVSVGKLVRRCDILLSVCPPHAALRMARSVASFRGLYVDANAVSPATVREIAGVVARCVDGGIIGGPSAPHLYLSGAEAREIAGLFEGTSVDARVLPGEVGAASALKMAYAGWTKGSAALLLAVRALARAEGVEETLLAEWAESIPELESRLESARRSAEAKGWRWVGEMEEIAATFAADDLPDGFHRAAAEVFRGYPRPQK
jgi:3-hydroxyisobutyrate dehydrogenase-like beta-hydroxyacid dehydrogenase